MIKDTIVARELAQALGVTRQAIAKRAIKEKWPHKNGGNREKRFTISALPEEVRVRVAVMIGKPIREQKNTPLLYNDRVLSPVFVGAPELTNQQNRIALARADLIRAYLGEKERAKSKKESVCQAGKLFVSGYNAGHLLPVVFGIIGGTSGKTLDRWVKQFRDVGHDYTVLAPRWGNKRGRTVTDEEFNSLLAFGLHPNKIRKSEIIRLTKMALKKRSVESPSCDSTLRRALDDWIKNHYDQWVFCREGEKALNDKVLPYIERNIDLLDIGEVLVADGHVLNFQILHPFTGKPCRMTMLTWYDWASCMPVGWEIMPSENVQCVAASLRRAILALGKMPKVAYLDNGKAFKAKIFTDTDIDFEGAGFYGMFARLGIETLFAWPYNAQSKVVERFFSTFNELERLLPTYIGASISDKPAHLMRNEKLHRKLHEKKYGGWVPTVEEANKIIAGWVTEYAQRPHRGLKGLRPIDLFESGRGPGVDEKALRFLMMSLEIKNVGRQGVRIFGRHYYDDALYGYRDRVMVRYDIEDLSSVYIYDVTGAKLICEAKPTRQLHPVARISGTKEDLAAVSQAIKHKRGLKKATEKLAREYVESAPDLIVIPKRVAAETTPPRKTTLPQAEAERIEAEAAEMKVLELKPKKIEPVYMSEADRYEALLEKECQGESTALDEMSFMRYFEKTDIYKTLKDRFEFLRETWLLEVEEKRL